jgi:hypothetical protein
MNAPEIASLPGLYAKSRCVGPHADGLSRLDSKEVGLAPQMATRARNRRTELFLTDDVPVAPPPMHNFDLYLVKLEVLLRRLTLQKWRYSFEIHQCLAASARKIGLC